MDRAPLIAIAGQGATTRLHKESHQILDLVNLFEPISKHATQIREPEIIPEVVRKAFKPAYPQHSALTVTGDAGFMMNSQKIETALHLGLAGVILIWHDFQYGLIKWHQERHFGRKGQGVSEEITRKQWK